MKVNGPGDQNCSWDLRHSSTCLKHRLVTLKHNTNTFHLLTNMDPLQDTEDSSRQPTKKQKSENKSPHKRKFWVHPANSARLSSGKFYTCFEEYRSNPDRFFEYFRMSVDSFDELLSLVGSSIARKETNFRIPIPAAERLAVTLRYLSSGMTMSAISQEYCLGISTIQSIIKTTCTALWDILIPIFMPGYKTEDDWVQIANKFYERTQFPNVIGALAGKIVQINLPHGNGSKSSSLVLIAWVNSDYNFIFIEVREDREPYEINSFKYSQIGQNLEGNVLGIPEGRALPKDESGKCVPFVLIADESFHLSTRIMRPFPKKTANDCQKLFNIRHGRAQQVVECSMRILSSKWGILQKPLNVDLSFCELIVKSCCVLHNFVRTRDGVYFEDTVYECPLCNITLAGCRGSTEAIDLRNYFVSYFNSPHGSVPWQYDKLTSS